MEPPVSLAAEAHSTDPMRGRGIGSAPDRTTRLLLACGAVGPPLFIVVALMEGAIRPGYSLWRHWVSLLLIGDGAIRMQIAAIACGLSVLAFAVGLRRVLASDAASRRGSLLLGVFGLSLTIAGVFAPDPMLGYPPGADMHVPPTLHRIVHGISGMGAFYALAAACFAMSRRFADDPRWSGWMLYSRATGTLVMVLIVAAMISWALDDTGRWPDAPTGLLDLTAIFVGWGWIALFASRLLRMTATTTADQACSS
jgi:hypothetical protein